MTNLYPHEIEMARILLVDTMVSESEEKESEFHDIFGNLSGSELTEHVPYVFRNYGLDMDDFLPKELALEIVRKTEQAWDGRLTVKELADYSDRAATSLALGAVGHGVSPNDDPNIQDFLAYKGVKVPRLHFESPYDEAYSALTSLGDAMIKSEGLLPKEQARLKQLQAHLSNMQKIEDYYAEPWTEEGQRWQRGMDSVQRKINVLLRRRGG